MFAFYVVIDKLIQNILLILKCSETLVTSMNDLYYIMGLS